MKKQVKKELLWLCGLGALALYATKNKRAAALTLAAGGIISLQKTESSSFVGHSVLITGGSRGLGLALARELVQEGANVTLLARDRDELAKARSILEKIGSGSIHIIVCDVTNSKDLKLAIVEAAKKFGGLDMLINNAGAITVGPWESMEQADFEAQMKLHAYAPINAVRFALPYFRKEGSGKRIVNICSMGGRVAVPHMLPYDTSKFALSGFSQGVAAELAGEGISVSTIYPTLMRTGSAIQAVFKGDHEKEFAWFQAGDVLPGISMPAQEAAQKIIQAARERRWELMPTGLGKLRMVAASFFPEIVGRTMALMASVLPKGQSKEYKTGAQSRALFDQSPLTAGLVQSAHDAEDENNQEPKTDARHNMSLH
jgi:NAD(P)-dependent dehydrogenase (short-subunit alcohol dehydrogenase family)